MREAQVAGRRVDQVDHRAIGVEQPGRLVDRGDEQLVDVAGSAVRVDAAGAASRVGALGESPRGGRAAARVGVVTGRGYDAAARGGIAVRRWRLRHPADAVVVSTTAARGDVRPPSVAVACPPRHDATPHRRCGLTPAIRPAMSVQRGPPPMFASRTSLRTSDVVVRAAIVALALATGYIHSTLGGLLFTLNAVGYAVAAIAIVIPLALAVRFRWVIRLGLIGYAATAILDVGHPGPVLPDRLHRQGDRGRADRPPRGRLRPPRRQPDRARPPRAGRLLEPRRPAAAPPPPAPRPTPPRHRQESPT